MEQKFFDACAGIGCFHLGVKKATPRATCVGIAEIDDQVRNDYIRAFGIDSGTAFSDVTGLIQKGEWAKAKTKMKGAVMLAGFPCTPWSKSGKQSGKEHGEGMVFWSLLEMMEDLESPAFIFENVTNLLGGKHEQTWKEMRTELDKKYEWDHEEVSTKEIGIPQNRKRVFIVGIRKDTGNNLDIDWEAIKERGGTKTLEEVLAQADGRKFPKYGQLKRSQERALVLWDKYLTWLAEQRKSDTDLQTPSPLWGMEALYKYDIEKLDQSLRKRKGKPIDRETLLECLHESDRGEARGMAVEEICARFLPPYYRNIALGGGLVYEDLRKFATNSRKHMKKIDDAHFDGWGVWKDELGDMEESFQKLEWNVGNEIPRSWKESPNYLANRFGRYLIQFRSSGVRFSKKKIFPTLVAIGQVPYTRCKTRHGELRQPHWSTLARLQSIPLPHIEDAMENDLFGRNGSPVKRLGNAVNVEIVRRIWEQLSPNLD